VVLLDQSPSAREATRAAVPALKVAGPVRYLAFAERAAWVENPHLRPPLGRATDLAAAFEKAREAHPARILLISDGLFTPAPPPAAVYAYPVAAAPHAEIVSLLAPPFPLEGERVELRVRVLLSQPARVRLHFQAGGETREVVRDLPAGAHGVGFTFVLREPTPVRVRLETPFGDDTAALSLKPAGKARALVLGDPAAARYLRAQGFLVEEAERLPATLPRLLVVGTSVEQLGQGAAERLARHLEEGGGLLFTTTPKGLFFGGWHRRFPLLPLKPKPPEPAAFVLVLDVSGSMAGEKLDRAVEGALAAVRAARESDLLGILVYSDRPRWLLPLGSASEARRRLAERRLLALRAGGGTRLAPALEAARQALEDLKASPKKVLLVTDGATEEKAGALAQAQAFRQAGIGLRVLAVGKDADRAFLKTLAQTAGGSYAEAGPAALAEVLKDTAEETFRTQFETGPFPLALRPHPITRGLSPPPPAGRLLPAQRKPWATAVLQSGEYDVLALGERGYGRVAALALDLGHDLKDWRDTPRLLANLARWLLDTPARPRASLYQDRLRVLGRFREDLWLRTEGRTLPIPPVGRMVYEVRVPPGSSDLLVYEGRRLVLRIPRKTSPEWPLQDGRETLRRLAEGSGGGLLPSPELGPPPRIPTPLSLPLALLALFALVVELALRRRVN